MIEKGYWHSLWKDEVRNIMQNYTKDFFETKKEFEIYSFVCRERKKCSEDYIKECAENKINPISWKGWKNHVNNRIDKYTDEQKEELLHYLINKQRNVKNPISIINGFVTAFFAALGVSLYVELIKDECGNGLTKSPILVLLFVLFVLWELFYITIRYQLKNSFYIDYIDLIEQNLKNKQSPL